MIETPRLTIRPFIVDDLDDIHRILDLTFGDGSRVDDPVARTERRLWLEWSILNHVWFPALHQPPYGKRAMVEYAFGELHLKHIIATTEAENLASQAVMRKLGMRIARNPLPTPPWLQVVGILNHPQYSDNS